MTAGNELERLTEAVDRLIVRLYSLKAERDGLAERILDLENRLLQLENGTPVKDEGYNILRIHSARLLREREELRSRLAGVLEKLETMQR
jgi:hypothetical protein